MKKQRGEAVTVLILAGFLSMGIAIIAVALVGGAAVAVHEWNVKESEKCAETDMDCHSKKAHEDLERYRKENPQ